MSAKRTLLVLGVLLVGIVCLAALTPLDDPLDINVGWVEEQKNYQGSEDTGFSGAEEKQGYFVNLLKWSSSVTEFHFNGTPVKDSTYTYVNTGDSKGKAYTVSAITTAESISLAGFHSVYEDSNDNSKYDIDTDKAQFCVTIKTH